LTYECTSCGACCAYSESWPVFIGDRDAEGIPEELIDLERERMQCYADRCAALVGTIGHQAKCSVYAMRPLVCREFEAGSADCLMVRRSFELPVRQGPL
jgi:Fe-S-cluster containining protein